MNEEVKEITPEQKKEIKKILFRARANVVLICIKFSLALFAANLACIYFGTQFFKDSDPQTLASFNMVATVTNILLGAYYLNGQLKANTASIADRVKAVLNKQKG